MSTEYKSIVTRIIEKFVNKNVAKVMSLLFIIASIFALYVYYRSTLVQYEQSITNWQGASMLLMLLASVSLSASEGDVYWATKSVTKKLDERQLQVRRRVLEKSYRTLIVIIPVMIIFSGEWVLSSLANNTLPSRGAPGLPLLDLILFLYALPCAVAAWQKDA